MPCKKVHLLLPSFLFAASAAFAHGVGPRGMHALDWHSDQVRGVIGYFPFSERGLVKAKAIAGKQCLRAPMLAIDVLDSYAFDIDETVEVEFEFYLEGNAKDVELEYDRSGPGSSVQKLTLPPPHENAWYRHSFTLERARFAGRPGRGGAHFMVGDLSLRTPYALTGQEYVIVCNINLRRSYTTSTPTGYGRLNLALRDHRSKPISARVGLYDASGRLPLPGPEALPIRYFSDLTRTVHLRPGSVAWPAKNHRAFYIDGSYHTRLPAGTYEIVVARGLEYRMARQTIDIEAGKEISLTMELERWIDMPSKGWFSGDDHIHYGRTSVEEDFDIRRHTMAEDLHIANLLQMGNIGTTYYRQYDWTPYGESPYMLVSGQEDPRTTRLGHTIQLNIPNPIRMPPEHYYIYHEVFQQARAQGGVSGYAHVGHPDYPGLRFGLALDIPFELVDFLEMLQMGSINTELWFDFLNLGYRLPPTAGTDYPYGDILGATRSYVHVGRSFSAQEWFNNLRAGRTFVTNGPMLEFSVNNSGMGSTIGLKRGASLTISGRAMLNPDIGRLHKLELVQHGEVVAVVTSDRGAEELSLNHSLRADYGSWLVLQVYGKRHAQTGDLYALSAPTYVSINGGGFCMPSAIASIVAKQRAELQKLRISTADEGQFEYEAWDTWELQKRYWPSHKKLIEERINDAMQEYDKVIALAANGLCIESRD